MKQQRRQRTDERPPNVSTAQQSQANAPRRPVVDPRIRYGILPLRLFLGVTFVYAALVKIADPGFLTPGSPTYLGTQMLGFAHSSPIGWLLTHVAIPLMPLTGIVVVLIELAAGLGALLGIYTRLAAALGAAFSFFLFLTASWSVQPYFLGNDSIYAIAWITLALLGDQGLWTLARHVPRLDWPRGAPGTDLERRAFLTWAGAAAVGVVWVLALLPRGQQRSGATSIQAAASSTSASTTSAATSAAAGHPPSGTPIGSVANLESQGSLSYTDPRSSDPAVVVALGPGKYAAFDAICTHAGCTVGYDLSQKLLVCPCHGGAFDPAHGAQVVSGPPPQPLSPLKVATFNGTVYATD